MSWDKDGMFHCIAYISWRLEDGPLELCDVPLVDMKTHLKKELPSFMASHDEVGCCIEAMTHVRSRDQGASPTLERVDD